MKWVGRGGLKVNFACAPEVGDKVPVQSSGGVTLKYLSSVGMSLYTEESIIAAVHMPQ